MVVCIEHGAPASPLETSQSFWTRFVVVLALSMVISQVLVYMVPSGLSAG